MRQHSAILCIGVVASIALFAAARDAQAQDKVIKIGGLFAMSGPGSYFGVQDKQGIELAIEQVNKTGVNGYRFEVQYEDSACSPLPATQAAKRLLEQYKPDVVLGEECSDATLAIMPLMEQAKVPLLNAGSSSIKVTDPGNPWTFRIMPNEVMQGVDIATNAYKRLNARTAVLLYENTNAGIGNAKVFGDTFKGQGLRITQALAQASVTKGGGGQSIQLGTIWLPFGFEQKAGKAALGYVRIVQFDPTDKRDVVQNFIRSFKAKYNQEPTHINAHAFDQILVVADVIRRGGKDSQSIRDIMATTKDFSGVTGSVEFDKTNQNTKMDTIHYMETLPDLSWKALGWN